MLEKKAFHFWIITIWKHFEYQILGFRVSIATLNCMQNTRHGIFGDQFYWQYILRISKNLSRL